MRGRCEARGLRRLRITPQVQVPFAFTTPLSLVRSMTRSCVRLLGPCFKTGRRGRRPTRDREVARFRIKLAIRDHSRARRRRSQAPGIRRQATNSNQGHGAPPAVRRAKSRRSAIARDANTEGRVLAHQPPPERRHRQLEPPERLRGTPPFTTTQFHVLLNSLFKVLFNFPSRYLFAIGLWVIFSLTRSLPRTLSCTPKQLDSRETPCQRNDRLTGLSPSTDHGPSQGGLGLVVPKCK